MQEMLECQLIDFLPDEDYGQRVCSIDGVDYDELGDFELDIAEDLVQQFLIENYER